MQKRAAAIDISDGLSLDLSRLCRESNLGAEISASKLPLARQAQALASLLGESALELALAGGEDYVLLFALPPNLEPPAQFMCARIGKFTSDRHLFWREASGRHPLLARGWDQLAE
jgi:thiamine-monophosphate kinase